MLGHPLFVGSDTKDQLRLIFELCGTPDQNDWSQATQLRGWKEMKPLNSIPNKLVQRFSRFVKNPVLDLLSKLLCLNPKKRITAAEALNHPWFKIAPLPNKDEKPLPGTARNEFWAKKKRELKHQLLNPQIGKRLHSVMSADQENTNSRSILKSSQASSTIGAKNEPVRKQQRVSILFHFLLYYVYCLHIYLSIQFNATDSDQNHYRSVNPPIQPTIARYRSQDNHG
jgi:serine/threonine protein kinase